MAGNYGSMPPMAQRSGGVTAVAVVNFVLGGLGILCGLLAFLVGGLLAGGGGEMVEKEMKRQGKEFKADGGLATAGTIIMIASIIRIGWGAGAIVGGIGLLGRKQWGRTLCLALAGVAAVLALLDLYATFAQGFSNIVAVLFDGGYAAMVFIILLKPEVAAEFS
jgi:hypothetical protein